MNNSALKNSTLKDTVFIAFQKIAPQHLLSRIAGMLADCRVTWLKDSLINAFINHFNVDMSEAAQPSPSHYDNFNLFFTRALRDGARPIVEGDNTLASPADGAISQLGPITQGRIFQAKGHNYSVAELLGGDTALAEKFGNGQFVTVYLSPRDYHRVHMPVTGQLDMMRYVPGKLFSVNQVTAENIPRVFARNERLVCMFTTEHGAVAMVLVGAMIVAGIETVWQGQIAPSAHRPLAWHYSGAHSQVRLNKGDEMGRFKLGSTVILLFENEHVQFAAQLQAGSAVRMGELLATVTAANTAPGTDAA